MVLMATLLIHASICSSKSGEAGEILATDNEAAILADLGAELAEVALWRRGALRFMHTSTRVASKNITPSDLLDAVSKGDDEKTRSNHENNCDVNDRIRYLIFQFWVGRIFLILFFFFFAFLYTSCDIDSLSFIYM